MTTTARQAAIMANTTNLRQAMGMVTGVAVAQKDVSANSAPDLQTQI